MFDRLAEFVVRRRLWVVVWWAPGWMRRIYDRFGIGGNGSSTLGGATHAPAVPAPQERVS